VRLTLSGVIPVTRRSAHGVLGAVSGLAAQLAHWGGATVLGTVRSTADLRRVPAAMAHHDIALDGLDPVADIRRFAPHDVDRIIEVALAANVDIENSSWPTGQ
jgi:NADPH2:quinone reductase